MVENITPFEALKRAIEILGSQSELARLCEVSPTAVWKWVQSSKRLPAEYVLRVADATGILIHSLRPDIYPVNLVPDPRWTIIDRRLPARTKGLDRLPNRVALDRGTKTKGATL